MFGQTWSKAGAAQHRRDLVQHLREGQDLRRLIHQDDAAGRMRRCVEPGDPGGHRVAHDDRAVEAQRVQQQVDPLGDPL